MITIPKQQVLDRWDTLPDILHEALTSEINSKILLDLREKEHLPEEKISIASRLTGYVLMGFLHPEDIAKEIQDNLGINPNIAASIANTLNSRIFSPLRDDLEKIYAPATNGSNPSAVAKTGQPILMEEIRKPFDYAQDKPFDVAPSTSFDIAQDKSLRTTQGKPFDTTQGKPFDTAQGKPAAPLVPEATWGVSLGVGGPKVIPTIPAPMPSASAEIPAQPAVSPSTTLRTSRVEPPKQPAVPSQQPSVKSSAFVEAPAVAKALADRSADKQRAATPAPALSGVEGPLILHQESEFSPIKPAGGFKLEIPGREFSETKPGLGIPPKPARIEIGSTPLTTSGSMPPAENQKPTATDRQSAPPRVVHYSESKTQLPPTPPSQGKTAQIPVSEPMRPAMSLPDASRSNESNPSNGSDLMKLTPAPMPPKPPSGIFNRVARKIFRRTSDVPARKFLPDPLKELELPKPQDKSNIKNQNAK